MVIGQLEAKPKWLDFYSLILAQFGKINFTLNTANGMKKINCLWIFLLSICHISSMVTSNWLNPLPSISISFWDLKRRNFWAKISKNKPELNHFLVFLQMWGVPLPIFSGMKNTKSILLKFLKKFNLNWNNLKNFMMGRILHWVISLWQISTPQITVISWKEFHLFCSKSIPFWKEQEMLFSLFLK